MVLQFKCESRQVSGYFWHYGVSQLYMNRLMYNIISCNQTWWKWSACSLTQQMFETKRKQQDWTSFRVNFNRKIFWTPGWKSPEAPPPPPPTALSFFTVPPSKLFAVFFITSQHLSGEQLLRLRWKVLLSVLFSPLPRLSEFFTSGGNCEMMSENQVQAFAEVDNSSKKHSIKLRLLWQKEICSQRGSDQCQQEWWGTERARCDKQTWESKRQEKLFLGIVNTTRNIFAFRILFQHN